MKCFVLSAVGCFAAVLWGLLLARIVKFLLMYEAVIRKLEDDLKVDGAHAIFSARSEPWNQWVVGMNTGFSAKAVAGICTVVAIMVWFFALIHFW